MKKASLLLRAVAILMFLPFASSHAQTNFVKYAGNPILPLGNPGEWDDTEAAHVHVSFDGQSFHMWYSGAPESELYRIGYATSADGINWNKHGNNWVLGPGPSGSHDDAGAWAPIVLFDGTQYEMWYSGNLFIGAIGYATSTDGINWDRHPGNPVLTKGGSGEWDNNRVFNPVVIRSDTLYKMWYAGQSTSDAYQTGYATSSDGVNWTKHPRNPVLRLGSNQWDAVAAFPASVVYEGGQYHMWYHGERTPDISGVEIGYATSPDGVNWTKHPDNPILQPGPRNWDGKNVFFPVVIKDGHRYRMWYTGTRPGTSIDRLGYAEDFSQAAHVDSIQISSKTVVAGTGTININAYIANPNSETLTARALIMNNDGSLNESMVLSSSGDNIWWGQWAIPAEADDYSVGIELNNVSAGYVHNSLDWGVFEEFSSHQLTHQFRQIASIDDGDDGKAFDVTLTSNGTVLLANGPDGLRAYTYNDTSFVNVGHVSDGGSAMGVTEGSDGTIYLANGDDGLRAYDFDGTSFINTAHIDGAGNAMALALASDGTIFLANGDDGLRAYSYDGASFVNTAHVNDAVDGEARTVCVAPDGTILLANRVGFWAYSYDEAGFSNIWHFDGGGFANGIAIGTGGKVFLGQGGTLYAYDHDGASFTRTAQISQFNDQDFWWAYDVAVAMDGTIFLSSLGSPINSSGLAALSFDGTSFIQTAHLDGPNPRDVVALSSDTIFLAGGGGLTAFNYAPIVISAVDDVATQEPNQHELLQNYPNPFNPATTISYTIRTAGAVELKIYNQLGQEIRTLVDSVQPIGTHQEVWNGRDDQGNVVANGVYFYRLKVGSLLETRKMLLIQ